MRLWLEVSKDIYELPIAVSDSVNELSKMTGASETTIRTLEQRWKSGNSKFSRFISIEIDETEDY